MGAGGSVSRKKKAEGASSSEKKEDEEETKIINVNQEKNLPIAWKGFIGEPNTFTCRFCGGRQCKREDWKRQEGKSAIDGLHSDWVTPNILACQRPSSRLIIEHNLIDVFLRQDIRAIFNLQQAGEHPLCGDGITESGFSYLPQTFMKHDIFFYAFGWVDFGTPTRDHMLNIAQVMEFTISRRQKLAVHCHAGLGRTGLAIACFLAYARGMTAAEAIELVRIRRPGSLQTKGQVRFVQDFANYVRKLRRVFPDIHPTDKQPYTVQDLIDRQSRLLHGEDSIAYRSRPKILAAICRRLMRVVGQKGRKRSQREVIDAFLIHPIWTIRDEDHVKHLKHQINNGDDIGITSASARHTAGLLMEWLKGLAEPLIPYNAIKQSEDRNGYTVDLEVLSHSPSVLSSIDLILNVVMAIEESFFKSRDMEAFVSSSRSFNVAKVPSEKLQFYVILANAMLRVKIEESAGVLLKGYSSRLSYSQIAAGRVPQHDCKERPLPPLPSSSSSHGEGKGSISQRSMIYMGTMMEEFVLNWTSFFRNGGEAKTSLGNPLAVAPRHAASANVTGRGRRPPLVSATVRGGRGEGIDSSDASSRRKAEGAIDGEGRERDSDAKSLGPTNNCNEAKNNARFYRRKGKRPQISPTAYRSKQQHQQQQAHITSSQQSLESSEINSETSLSEFSDYSATKVALKAAAAGYYVVPPPQEQTAEEKARREELEAMLTEDTGKAAAASSAGKGEVKASATMNSPLRRGTSDGKTSDNIGGFLAKRTCELFMSLPLTWQATVINQLLSEYGKNKLLAGGEASSSNDMSNSARTDGSKRYSLPPISLGSPKVKAVPASPSHAASGSSRPPLPNKTTSPPSTLLRDAAAGGGAGGGESNSARVSAVASTEALAFRTHRSSRINPNAEGEGNNTRSLSSSSRKKISVDLSSSAFAALDFARNSGLASPTSITIGGRPGSARAASLSVADLERGEGERKVSQSINGVLLKRRSSSVRDLHVDTSAGGPNALGTHTVGIGVMSVLRSGSGNPTGHSPKSKRTSRKSPSPKGQSPAAPKKRLINATKASFNALRSLSTSNSAPNSRPRSPTDANSKSPRSTDSPAS